MKLPETLCVKEVAAHLGISIASAYKLIRRPDFPKIRIGSVYRIPAKLFLQWVDQEAKPISDSTTITIRPIKLDFEGKEEE